MSKPETTGTTITKSYKYFDLDTFEVKTEEKQVTFSPARDLAEAQQRVGGDEATLLKALNSFLRTEALRAAENEVTSKGGKRTVVLAVAKPFRGLPPFSQIYKLGADGKPVVENGEKVIDRAAQTKAILNMIKSNPAMLETIKAGSQIESEDDENDTEE
jgi:hypothetical protein